MILCLNYKGRQSITPYLSAAMTLWLYNGFLIPGNQSCDARALCLGPRHRPPPHCCGVRETPGRSLSLLSETAEHQSTSPSASVATLPWLHCQDNGAPSAPLIHPPLFSLTHPEQRIESRQPPWATKQLSGVLSALFEINLDCLGVIQAL